MNLSYELVKETRLKLNLPSNLFLDGNYHKSTSEKSFENINCFFECSIILKLNICLRILALYKKQVFMIICRTELDCYLNKDSRFTLCK